MRLTLAGREHYVVSTEKVANDLLRERGGLYSGRPGAPASADLLSRNLRPVLLPYNGTFVTGAKSFVQTLNGRDRRLEKRKKVHAPGRQR